MKFLMKIFSISFLVCALTYLFSVNSVSLSAPSNRSSLTFLVVGFDESPANTDVLSVMSYDSRTNALRVVQIPRDTYFNYGGKTGKINGVYLNETANGATHAEALKKLSEKISDALGVKIDGCIAFKHEGFVELIDYMGGIEIETQNVPKALRSDKSERDGKIYFNGREALKLVRYREDYSRGDLERLDAQKIFIKAVLEKIKNRRDKFSLFKFVSRSENIYFNVNKGLSASVLLENVFKIGDSDFQIATLPGKAVKYDGVWYYIISKNEAAVLIEKYFPYTHSTFDVKKYFIIND